MLHARLDEIRLRLDALREGQVRTPTLIDRARARLEREKALPPLEVVPQLDRELDKVGVHTAQDALLLRALGVRKGRAGGLAQGLRARAVAALEEYEERLRRVERALLAGAPLPGALTTLEHAFPRLARAVKVADIFSLPTREEANVAFEIFERPRRGELELRPTSARVAVAEFWAERARANALDVVQKRRDLDAAHELLLRIGADFDRDRVRLLRVEVSQARERVRAAPPVRSVQELVRHTRSTARSDPGAAYRALRGLYERAVEADDAPLAEVSHAALRTLLPRPPALREIVEQAEGIEAREWIGVPAVRAEALPQRADEVDRSREALTDLAFELDEERLAMFELAAGCARFFDVDEALAVEDTEARWVEEQVRRPRRVPYPTQRMTFETTNSLHEVNDFVITDPRTFLYDLASNRLPVRVYLEEAPPPRPKRVKRTAVRVYVCDASGSMHGARARFRDAILIAELNNLRRKALAGQPVDPLYFSFFDDSPSELIRVDTAAEASLQIERLFRESPAHGQTHITLALRSAFQSIRAAQGQDPYLARATVVLITDGEDRIDPESIRGMRAPLGALEIAMSFISLGEENADLKALVMEQRRSGGRAFYHHLSDREIGAARTEFDAGPRTLLPREVPANPESLEQLLPHLEALEAIAAGKAPVAHARPEVSFDAVFPEDPSQLPRSAPPEPTELARIADILDAIAEACSLAPIDLRGGESVTLLHHLLSLYGIPLPRYLGALAVTPEGSVRDGLARVRLICRPFG